MHVITWKPRHFHSGFQYLEKALNVKLVYPSICVLSVACVHVQIFIL